MVRIDDDIRVREAITTLPKEQAQVIELSFFAGQAAQCVIAMELGLPLGTVKSRLRLAMARIRAALGEDASLTIVHHPEALLLAYAVRCRR